MHLPGVCVCAFTPCYCPIPTTSPVPPGIQFLSTIQLTSQLHLILIQLLFSNQSQGISLKSQTLTHFHVHIHSYNLLLKPSLNNNSKQRLKII